MPHPTRRLAALLAAIAAVSLVAPALAEPDAPATRASAPAGGGVAEVDARLAALVADLSSDEFIVREKARLALVDLGPAALPTLRQLAATSADPDVSTVADLAARQIEKAGLVDATLVTVELEQATPTEIFEELARQQGCAIEFEGGAFRNRSPADFSADREPFWSAFHRACLLFGVRPTTAGWRPGLRVESDDPARPWTKRPAAVSGPFLIVMDEVNATTRVEMYDPAKVEGIVVVSFAVLPEPKLDVPWQSPRVQTTRVEDDAGADWGEQPYSAFPSGSDTGRATSWRARTRLARPFPAGDAITLWRGASVFEVATAYEPVELRPLRRWVGAEQPWGGGRFAVESLEPDGERGDGWAVTVRAERGTLDPWDFQQLAHPQHRLRLLDADGREWRYQHRNDRVEFTQDRTVARVTLHFAAPDDPEGKGPPGPPDVLRWDVPSDSLAVPLEFGFEGFPVP